MCQKYLRMEHVTAIKFKGRCSTGKIYDDIVTEINECYLFHGTIVDNTESVHRQGLDPRISETGLFGRGIYFTDSSTKADQNTGNFLLLSGTTDSFKHYTLAPSVRKLLEINSCL